MALAYRTVIEIKIETILISTTAILPIFVPFKGVLPYHTE
jgi:hypothetical protein